MTRLLLLGLFMAIVGTATSYFQLSRFLRADLTKSVQMQQTALANYIAADVDHYLRERLSLLQRLAVGLPQELLTQPERLNAWLAERTKDNTAFSLGLVVADDRGNWLAGADQPAVGAVEFVGALGGRTTVGKPLAVAHHLGLPIAAPVHDSTGRVVAVLVGTANLSADGLLDHLQGGRVGETGGILVVSPRDQLFIASTDTTMSLKSTPPAGINLLHDQAMQGFRGSGTTRNAQGVDEISAIASVPSTSWFVVARLPMAEALSPVARMQSFILTQRAPAVLAVLCMIGLILAWLLRPLTRAAVQAERMARGEVELAPILVVRDDEIGHLTSAFNRLLSRLADNQAELKRLATHDTLTGLPNRQLLVDRLQETLTPSKEQAAPVAVLYLDLDGFKQLNDTFGHEAGDQALCEIARRLLGLVRQTDTVARIGGDEFVLLTSSLEEPAEQALLTLAERCIAAVAEPLQVCGVRAVVSVSIGIAVAGGGATPQSLMDAADKAMYAAKQSGRGRHAVAPRGR
ncbi:MAG: diguanylate cyclase [Variovorax sp.]|nr:diguanylate cyclase [Variovorax sp.]